MKRTLAAITSGIVALALAVVGITGSAGAASAAPAAGDSCASSPTWSYSYNAATASGSITASQDGVAAGTVLCSPLYVRSATWNYNLPTSGTNPSWGQTFNSQQDVVVTAVGVTVSYASPNVTGRCQQHDTYGTLNSAGFGALALPTILKGPNNPYEPQFLHSALNGKGAVGPNYTAGPTPTYTSDTPVGCTVITPTTAVVAGTCTWDNAQQSSFKTASLTFDNSTSNVPVDFTVTGFPAYARTVAAHESATVTLPAVN